MITTTYVPTQQRWTSPALVPTCAHTSALVREVGVDVRVRGTGAPFAGIRAAGATAATKATLPGTSAWRPPTS